MRSGGTRTAQWDAPFPRAFWALWFITVVGWAGRLVMPFLTLYLTVEAGYSIPAAGLVMSLFGAGGIVAVIAAGVLIDRFSARNILLAALIGTGAVAVALAVCVNDILTAMLVLLLGATSQAMAPALNSLVAEVVSAVNFRRAYSFVYIGLNAGYAVGPAAAGVIAEISYRLIFVAEASFMLVAVLTVLVAVPRGAETEGATPDAAISDAAVSDAAVSNPAVSNVVASNIPTATTPHLPKPDQPALHSSARSGLKHVFGDRVFMQFAVWNVLFMIIYMQSQITLPLVLDDEGYTSSQYGVLLALNGVLLVIFQLPIDRATKGATQGMLLVAGMAIVGVGFVGHIFASSFWLYALCVVVWTSGELVNMPVGTSVAARLAPGDLRGRYMGIYSTSFSVGSFVGPLLGGVALQVFGPNGLWLCCGALALVVVIGRWWSARPIDTRLKGAFDA